MIDWKGKIQRSPRTLRYLLHHRSHKLINTLRFLFTPRADRLLINSWVELFGHEPLHRNLGDELNVYILRACTKKRLFNALDVCCHRSQTNYVCIGSVVDFQCTPQSVVWGAGAIKGNCALSAVPKRVTAVRGPLTRDYLLQRGVPCPPVYGDPALLLPLIYTPAPSAGKRYRLGIIPHYQDENAPALIHLLSAAGGEAVVIHLEHYHDWHEQIDLINSCDFIVSSSLHGCILSDTYGVPNRWVHFAFKHPDAAFKFRDYYGSVGKDISAPYAITADTTLSSLLALRSAWQPPALDLRPLIAACPIDEVREHLEQLWREQRGA